MGLIPPEQRQVQIPVDVPIGIWKLKIFTGETSEPAGRLRLYDCPNDIYILFNPWCEGLYSCR
jgi:hypothetical protein